MVGLYLILEVVEVSALMHSIQMELPWSLRAMPMIIVEKD